MVISIGGIVSDFIFFYIAFLYISSFLKWICSSPQNQENNVNKYLNKN